MTVIPYHHLENETMHDCTHAFCPKEGFEFDADAGKVTLKCWSCYETFTVDIHVPTLKVCNKCDKPTTVCKCQVCLKHNEPCVEYTDWNKITRMRLPDVEDGWCEQCACQECGEMPKGTIARAMLGGNPAPNYECDCKEDMVTLKVPKSILKEVMDCFERSGF